MKLAQALIERADLQRRMAQLTSRMQQNAKYQEGELPSENPNDLLEQYHQLADLWENLVVSINLRNSQITLPNGLSMTAALAQRDRLKAQHAVLIKLADCALPEQSRYSHSEIKLLPAVDIKAIRQQTDQIAKLCRQLDMLIQEANWLNDL